MFLGLSERDTLFLLNKICTQSVENIAWYMLMLSIFRHDFRSIEVFYKGVSASLIGGIIVSICTIADLMFHTLTMIQVVTTYIFLAHSFKFIKYEAMLMILATYSIYCIPEYLIYYVTDVLDFDDLVADYQHSMSYFKDLASFFCVFIIGRILQHKHVGYTLTFESVKFRDWFKRKHFISILISFILFFTFLTLYQYTLVSSTVVMVAVILVSIINVYTLYCKNRHQIMERHTITLE